MSSSEQVGHLRSTVSSVLNEYSGPTAATNMGAWAVLPKKIIHHHVWLLLPEKRTLYSCEQPVNQNQLSLHI